MDFGPLDQMVRPQEEHAQNPGIVLRRLAAYISPFGPRLVVVGLLVIIGTLMQLVGPYLIGQAVDRFISAGNQTGLNRTMGWLLVSYFCGWAANAGQSYWISLMAQRILATLRAEIFAKLQRLPLRYLDQYEAGDLLSRLVSDVDALGHVLNAGLVRMLGGLLTLSGILATMLSINPRLALASLAVLPCMALTTVFIAQRARADQQHVAPLDAESGAASLPAVGFTSAMTPAMDVLSNIALAIVVGYGGYLTIQGQATVGTIVAFSAYVTHFQRPIMSLATLYGQSRSVLVASERIFELLDVELD